MRTRPPPRSLVRRGRIGRSDPDVGYGPSPGTKQKRSPGVGEQRLGVVEHRDRAVEVASRLQQCGRGGVPAVSVLQQRGPVAELPGDLEVLRGPVEVALLAQDVREADVQIAGTREHRARVALGRGQRAFVEPARLDRAPARLADGRYRSAGFERIPMHGVDDRTRYGVRPSLDRRQA